MSSSASHGPVAIIGGGIGGLTLALELHAAGVRCQVFEAVPELTAAGVGINLLPHATSKLDRLGLLGDLAAAAVTERESVYYTRFGQHIYTEPIGAAAGYSHPQLSIHRGDLQAVLAAAVRDRLGPDALVTGHRCTGFEQDESGVTLRFSRTDGTETTFRAAGAVGCDGIHSVVRRQFHPDEGEPVYSGYNMWRGVTVHDPILTGASMIRIGWLAVAKLVIYPIRNNIDGTGKQLVNWVVEIPTPEHATRDWIREGKLEDFIGVIDDWHFDWLDVPALVRGADTILEYAMVDAEPLEWWGAGRVTLLGDAAHPMTPNLGQGACQALEDALVLAHALKQTENVNVALQLYQARRIPRTTRIVNRSWNIGRIAQWANPFACILRDTALKWMPSSLQLATFEEVVGHEV